MRVDIAGRPTRPVTENSTLRAIGKRVRTGGLTLIFELLFDKGEKEGFVLNDRAAHAAGQIVAIEPGRGCGRPHSIDDRFVVGPGIRVQLRVSNCPKSAAVNLVGAGFGKDLHLAITAAQFRVNRGENHPEFLDHIGMQHGDRADAIRITAVLNAQPVADGIDH